MKRRSVREKGNLIYDNIMGNRTSINIHFDKEG
jgi:hypothetical protein